MSEFENEKAHLKEVLNELTDRRELLLKKLDKVYSSKMDPEISNALTSFYAKQIIDIDNHGNSPYFAKLIYKEQGEKDSEELYIGKVGFSKCNDEIMVVDWRAPISTLYYDSELGDVSYFCPEGIKKGHLSLKRQIEIENRELKSTTDSDLMTNDELLRPYLNQNSDKRLKTIIATIQSEQNRIIRAPRQNLIVQGIAGSGKTTVALHRLSYLIYQMKKFDTTSDYLIIGPNKIFLQYISSVLPDLDTGEASQLTYEELAREVVGENFTVNDKNEVLKDLTEDLPAPEHLKLKTSLQYRELIDKFLENLIYLFLSKNVNYNGIEIFSKKEILETYNANRGGDFQSELVRTSNILSEKLSSPNASKLMLKKVEERAKESGIDFTLKDQWKLRDIFEKGCYDFIKKQIVFKKISIINIYSEFIKFLNELGGYEQLVKATTQNIKKKSFDFEDLPALIYLRQKICPCRKFENICHVIIDEAQDLGIFHYKALKTLFGQCIFDLYGDLNQAIYGHSSINDWEEVRNNLLNNESQYFELTKSYRTTVEIMNAANLVGNRIYIIKGEPVIRHGDKVIAFENLKDDYEKALTEIVKDQQEKYNVVAILCKNNRECNEIKEILTKNQIKCSILCENSQINGVVIATIYQSKGLEFDCVILADASNEKFDEANVINMKLLYVALTRAMHDLKILAKGEILAILKPLIN